MASLRRYAAGGRMLTTVDGGGMSPSSRARISFRRGDGVGTAPDRAVFALQFLPADEAVFPAVGEFRAYGGFVEGSTPHPVPVGTVRWPDDSYMLWPDGHDLQYPA